MAPHPYAYAGNSSFHHYRTQPSTPSSSVSQLSIYSQTPSSFDGIATAGPSNLPISPPSDTTSEPSHNPVGPERRRRRSNRSGAPKPANRKKSAELISAAKSAVGSIPEDGKPNSTDALVPTRNYQFKPFKSFDSAIPNGPQVVPAGSEYTVGPAPATSVNLSPPQTAQHAAPGDNVVHAKKSSALLNVGKRVVKEVLGGGKGVQPTEAKIVYYGRGGAGGGSGRSTKSQSATPGTHTFSVRPVGTSGTSATTGQTESHRSSSYYTSSSAYTPSLVSSPYEESVADSPYATSVDDGSVYGGSVHSAPHASSLRPSAFPSPSHRSVSPAGLSDSRRGSVASPQLSTSGDYDETFDNPVQGNAWGTTSFPDASQMAVPYLGVEGLPNHNGDNGQILSDLFLGNTSGGAMYSGQPSTPGQLDSAYASPSQQLLSTSTGHSTTATLSRSASFVTAPSTSSLPSSPYVQNATQQHVSEDVPQMDLGQPSLPQSTGNTAFAGLTNGLSADPSMDPLLYAATLASLTNPAQPIPDPTSLAIHLATQGQNAQAWPTTTNNWQSSPSMESVPPPIHTSRPLPPAPDQRTARPLPDPLAAAVGQLSLMQNPMNVGWPRPQSNLQAQIPRPRRVSHQEPSNLKNSYIPPSYADTNSTAMDLIFHDRLPNYVPQPSTSVFTGSEVGPRVTSPPTSNEAAIQQALAEQQTLQRKILELERLHQQQQRQQQQQAFNSSLQALRPHGSHFL